MTLTLTRNIFLFFTNQKPTVMRKNTFYAVFVIAASFMSCNIAGERVNGNGNLKSESRNISNAPKIKVVGGLDVFVDQGAPAIKVEGDENILRYIETESDNDWLEIKTKDRINIHSQNPIKVYVTTPEIDELKVTGSGSITCQKKLSSPDKMFFSITGSGNINADVNAPEVNAAITGSGNLYLKGETRDADIHVTGSGNYNSPDLKAENAAIKISGSGDANLFADVSLKASISGSGDIKYRGNAAVEKHIAGSGSVIKVP